MNMLWVSEFSSAWTECQSVTEAGNVWMLGTESEYTRENVWSNAGDSEGMKSSVSYQL